MLKLLKRSPVTWGIGILIATILVGISIYILINTTRIVLTFDAQDAVVVECDGSWTTSNGKRTGRYLQYVYAPVAQTDDGETARSYIRLSRKSWCQRLIGTQTTIYVNPDPKGKNTYGGFMAFWLFPAIILIIIATVAGRQWGKYFALSGIAISFAVLAYEFSAFGVNDRKESVLLTPEGKFDACINKHMADEGITTPRDLTKLVCYTPTNLNALWDMQRLEILRVADVDLIDMDGLATLPNLKTLSLARIPNLSDFSGLAKFPELENLLLHDLALNSIRDIPDLQNLQGLRLWNAGNLVDLDGIQRFKNLRELEIDRNAIADISALADLSDLEYFMGKNEPFTDISALANKPVLRTARFSNTKVTDFSPLFGLPKLFHTGASGTSVPCEQMEKLRASLSKKPSLWLPKHCK
tara:strand:- start:53007 stop:54242 length:1236 start_codon:yes stop_codon:yes gene_type:complete